MITLYGIILVCLIRHYSVKHYFSRSTDLSVLETSASQHFTRGLSTCGVNFRLYFSLCLGSVFTTVKM